jgi:hypothetical protein
MSNDSGDEVELRLITDENEETINDAIRRHPASRKLGEIVTSDKKPTDLPPSKPNS